MGRALLLADLCNCHAAIPVSRPALLTQRKLESQVADLTRSNDRLQERLRAGAGAGPKVGGRGVGDR